MCQLKSCAHFQSETLRAVRILRFQSLSTCRHPRFSFLPFFSPFSLLRNFLFPNSYPPTALPSTPAFRATGRPPRSHATVRPGGAGPRSSGGLSRRGSRPEVRLLAPFSLRFPFPLAARAPSRHSCQRRATGEGTNEPDAESRTVASRPKEGNRLRSTTVTRRRTGTAWTRQGP